LELGHGEQPDFVGVLPQAWGFLFFNSTAWKGFVGSREAISSDSKIRDELDQEFISFRGDGAAGGRRSGEVTR
jgi:hypothetical protein